MASSHLNVLDEFTPNPQRANPHNQCQNDDISDGIAPLIVEVGIVPIA